jgi:UDP-glucose 4-epimerase
MYKIIVTGGNGFIGAHLVDRLVEEGHSVHVIDDRSANLNDSIFNDKALYYRYDIGDKKEVELLSYVFDGADYVFHLAAESRIQPAIKNPHKAHMTNGIGTLNILDMCHRFKIKKVIYSSTSSVYENDDTLDIETNEDHPISCLNPYSISKFFGEELC